MFEYDCLGKHVLEHAYISYVDDEDIILNEESIDYKWCTLDEFIDNIKWYYDKDELKTMLKKYITDIK